MQLFLLGYIAVSICEIFSVGHFPISGNVRIVSQPTHRSEQVHLT